MKKNWPVLLLVILLLALSSTPALAAGFSGTWKCDKVIWQFWLELSEEGNYLTGKHFSSRDYSSRIDSSGDKISIQGVVSGNVASVNWKSGYNSAQGKATITMIDEDTIRWQRKEITVSQTHYIPEDVVLTRAIPGQAPEPPAPWGPDDMTLLYRTAKPTQFTLNGSLDGAISVLGQPKSREPFYWEREPSGYTYKWGDTEVIVGLRGRIIFVGTNGSSILTARGIGRGAYTSTVERVYGQPSRVWKDRGSRQLRWTYYHPDGGRLIFGFDNIERVEFFQYTILPGR